MVNIIILIGIPFGTAALDKFSCAINSFSSIGSHGS